MMTAVIEQFEANGTDLGLEWSLTVGVDDETQMVSHYLSVGRHGGGGGTSPLGTSLLDGYHACLADAERNVVGFLSQVRPDFAVYAAFDDQSTKDATLLMPPGISICFCLLLLDRRPRRVVAVRRIGREGGQWLDDPIPPDMPCGLENLGPPRISTAPLVALPIRFGQRKREVDVVIMRPKASPAT